MKYTHESERINALVGKRVTMLDIWGDVYIGKLEKEDFGRAAYKIICENKPYNCAFYKSHVKRIEVAIGG